jgi:hypothetical protein
MSDVIGTRRSIDRASRGAAIAVDDRDFGDVTDREGVTACRGGDKHRETEHVIHVRSGTEKLKK